MGGSSSEPQVIIRSNPQPVNQIPPNVQYQYPNQQQYYQPVYSPYSIQHQAYYGNMYTNQPLVVNRNNGYFPNVPNNNQNINTQPANIGNTKSQVVHTLELDVSIKKESLKLVF